MTKFDKYTASVLSEHVVIEEDLKNTLRSIGLGATLALSPLTAQAAVDSSARGVKNNNPGNIVKSTQKWNQSTGDDGKFLKFTTSEDGIRALGVLIRTYYNKHNLKTIDGILGRYTNPDDDPVESYVNYIVKKTGTNRDKDLELFNPDGTINNKSNLTEVIKAIIGFENKNYQYPEVTLTRGISMINPDKKDTATKKGLKYIVVAGDTLSKIAKRFNVSVNDIQKTNNIVNPNNIQIGAEISIP